MENKYINKFQREADWHGTSALPKSDTYLLVFTEISTPPIYDKRCLFKTDKGITTGILQKTDSSGHHFYFNESNQAYWNSARVIKWAYLPEK